MAFFDTQAEAVAEAIREHGTDAGASALFRPEEWEEQFLAVVGEGLERAASRGASTELEAFDEKAAHPQAIELPSAVLDRVRAWVGSTMQQPHWEGTNAAIKDDIAAAIRAGVEGGESGPETAERVRRALGEAGETRAMLIARTEVTGALNAGHQASREHLADKGLIKGKRWLAILDGDTRPSHRQASGQEVPVKGEFVIDGERCQHPGDNSLSVGNRARCRCTTISVTALDDD
jgi:uncharacterized protein with gpF-like domain